MPVIKSAKKKLRQDKKRQKANKVVKERLVTLLKKAKKTKTAESIRLASQAADKAAKKFIIHTNKASRIKSALAKLLPKEKAAAKPVEKQAAKATKPTKKSTKK
jgi:small subunit ribosomal protein S20